MAYNAMVLPVSCPAIQVYPLPSSTDETSERGSDNYGVMALDFEYPYVPLETYYFRPGPSIRFFERSHQRKQSG